MQIINCLKCEFIKNYSLKNWALIFCILLLSVICLTESNIRKNYVDETINLDNLIATAQNKLEQNNNLSATPLKQAYYDFYYTKEIEILTHLKNDVYKSSSFKVQNDWQYNYYTNTIFKWEQDIYLSNLLLNNRDNIEIQSAINGNSGEDFDVRIHILNEYNEEELKTLQKDYEQQIKAYSQMVDTGNYYQIYSYGYDSQNLSLPPKLRKYKSLILDRKITDELNYNYTNMSMYRSHYFDYYLEEYFPEERYRIVSLEEYRNSNLKSEYSSYAIYQNAYKFLGKDYQSKKKILEYALEHDLPSDILYNQIDSPLFTAKNNVNTFSQLSFVIMLLITLTSVNIIIGEFTKGTIQILFTSNIKKWKILLSKFLYLIIHSYLLWVLLFSILYIYSGFKFGFKDLFYPELVFNGTKVIKVNYVIYNLIAIIIVNIPIIAFISFFMLLSVISLNNVLTTMVATFLSIITSFIWYLIAEFHLSFLVNTIIPYFNLYEILRSSKEIALYNDFNTTLQFASTNLNKGILICLVTIIINYIITNYLFKKKEI